MADELTVIGSAVTIRGNITGDGDVSVGGRVEGDIELTATLHVDSGGVVQAEVRVRRAVVGGTVLGNIRAEDSVELLKGCRVVGDVTAARFIMEDGALFRGGVEVVEEDGSVTPLTPVATAAAPAPVERIPTARTRSSPIPEPRAVTTPARAENPDPTPRGRPARAPSRPRRAAPPAPPAPPVAAAAPALPPPSPEPPPIPKPQKSQPPPLSPPNPRGLPGRDAGSRVSVRRR